MIPRFSLFLLVVSALSADAALRDEPEIAFAPLFAFSTARSSGLSGSGAALLQPSSGLLLNPAFPNAYGQYHEVKRFSLGGGYARGSVFDDHVAHLSAGIHSKENVTLAGSYRFLRRTERDYQHEAVLNYSSKLFNKSVSHGAVDFGVNIRYARTLWSFSALDSLPVITQTFGNTPDTLWQAPNVTSGDYRDQRVVLDIGFYQPYLADRLDFGITLHNILGYAWRDIRPSTERIYRESDSTVHYEGMTYPHRTFDTLRYVDEYTRETGWLPGLYRTLTVGIAFRTDIVQQKINLVIPADLSFFGLFDSDIPSRVGIRTGAELGFSEAFQARFGYAFAPQKITYSQITDKDSTINEHILTGGASVHFYPLSIEAYVGKQVFGMSLLLQL